MGTPPTLGGGIVVDGTYLLSKFEMYVTSSLPAISPRQTLVIAGGCIQGVVTDTDGATPRHFTSTYATKGTGLTFGVLCGKEPGGAPFTYEATADTFRMGGSTSGTSVVATYVLKK